MFNLKNKLKLISPKEFEEKKKEYRDDIIEEICDDIDDGLYELAAKKI